MRRVTLRYESGHETVHRCRSVAYGVDTRNALLKLHNGATLLLPLHSVRFLLEEEVCVAEGAGDTPGG